MCYIDSDTPRAIGLLQSSLELEVALGRVPGQAAALSNLGHCHRRLGDLPQAVAFASVRSSWRTASAICPPRRRNYERLVSVGGSWAI
jgi:hypothetical protein